MVRIGQISYGMYLWHALPVGLLNEQTVAGNVFAMAGVVSITIGLALISERWVERPFRKSREAPVSGFASDPAPSATPSPSPS
jgi:peptidoglycan/LPS O-acetylase OafA/YrhL